MCPFHFIFGLTDKVLISKVRLVLFFHTHFSSFNHFPRYAHLDCFQHFVIINNAVITALVICIFRDVAPGKLLKFPLLD